MNYSKIIEQAFFYLKNGDYPHTQKLIVEKLKAKGYKTAPATLTTVKKGTAGRGTIVYHTKALQRLLREEFNLIYDTNKEDFVLINNETPTIAFNAPSTKSIIPVITKGRLKLEQKMAFMLSAKFEIIELGLSLRTFTSYFRSHSYDEFGQHVEKLLRSGVNIKCFVLSPTSTAVNLLEEQGEKDLKTRIQKVLEQLELERNRLKNKGFKGTISAYTYTHFPYNHFNIIDGIKANGRMIISNYAYGIKRADCPVFKFTKQQNPLLFERYWGSYQKTLANATKVF